jgi:hypothetical protein
VLCLTPELEDKFEQVEEQLEGIMGKPFMRRRERRAREEGLAEGAAATMTKAVFRALDAKYSGLTQKYNDKIVFTA